MKLFKIITWASLTASVLFLASCATAPKTTAPEKAVLSASEKSLYEDALVNMRAGEMEKASDKLKKITQDQPDFFAGWINLAAACYYSNNIALANAAVSSAQKINPQAAEAYNLAGLINVANADYQAAEKNYLAAIAKKNNYAAAHYNLAVMYDIFYQDIDKAITHYEQYLTLNGNTDKVTQSWVAELKAKLKRKPN